MSSFPMTSIFSMKYESRLLVGGRCVGGLGEKEMMWYSHLTEVEKIGCLSSVECQLEVSEF